MIEDLLGFGAEINALPPGFHVRCTALHYAAMNGRAAVCEFLLQRGASPTIADGSDERRRAAAWASYGKHEDLAVPLARAADKP